MAKFKYKGRYSNGKITQGIMDSDNADLLGERLLRDGIVPLEINPVEKEALQQLRDLLDHVGFNQPTLKDMSILTQQLHALTRAGVPIVDAISMTCQTSRSIALKESLKGILGSLEGGQTLANAMKAYPRIYPMLMLALVKIGENTGGLDKVFKELSKHFEKELQTRRRMKEAVRYPITVLIVMAIALLVVNVFVIPAFSSFFASFGANLPLATRILIQTSEFILDYWPWFVGGLIGLIISFVSYLKTKAGRLFWDETKLRFPLIGGILERSHLSRLIHSFVLCLTSGVPLIDTIEMISKTQDNVYITKKVLMMKDYIERGESLSAAAKRVKIFTPLVLQMIMIGEKSGDLERLLAEVALYYEDELDYDLKKLSEAIEPVLIILLACMVLVLALGIFLPMWDISQVALQGG